MRRWAALGLLVLAAAVAGCGSSAHHRLRVSAATSLRTAFGRAFGDRVQLQFAGTDQLAAQIRRGARPDVIAAANTRIPASLYAAGLVERPATFASNRLVLAVPARAARVRSLDGLTAPGVTIAIGSPTVPVGEYTRKVLSRLRPGLGRAILAHVRSLEPDVGGVVGKLEEGAGDAGFVYITDVRAAGGRLRAIELPRAARPRVTYAAAVVRGGNDAGEARRFVSGLRTGRGAEELRRAGFTPP